MQVFSLAYWLRGVAEEFGCQTQSCLQGAGLYRKSCLETLHYCPGLRRIGCKLRQFDFGGKHEILQL